MRNSWRHPALSLVLCLGFLAHAPPAAGGGDRIFADGFEAQALAACSSSLCKLGLCSTQGASCSIDADCCSYNCDAGRCGSAAGACAVQGSSCSSDGACCSFNCASTCASSGVGCDPIGEACTAGNSCCSAFCATAAGAACSAGAAGCRCAPAFECRARGDSCSANSDCCNGYCDRPGNATVGRCASLGGCRTAGEPCGQPGPDGSCCSNSCVAGEVGVAVCGRLGGCLPQAEVCSASFECCSGACTASGATLDGRPVMRCASNASCQPPGEICFTGSAANCCPPGGGSFGCATAASGTSRCFGGIPGCVLPGTACTQTEECCSESFPGIQCQAGQAGSNVCCLSPGQSCAFGDICCSGVCAPDGAGALKCATGCLASGATCTTQSDCCGGRCTADGSGRLTCSQ